MKQYKFTSSDYANTDDLLPDCVMDQQDIDNLQVLAGIAPAKNYENQFEEGSNISKTANEKAELQRKHNIKPGTQEWFRLWFSLPYMTGETPIIK